MADERRQYVRWKNKIRVAYSITEADKIYQEVFTEDFSESGLQILTADRMEPQQKVKLRLEFVYDAIPILITARVAYVDIFKNKYRVGLEFADINDFDKQRIKRCLEKVRQDFQNEAK